MPEVLDDHEDKTFCMKVAMYTSHELEHNTMETKVFLKWSEVC